MSALTKNSRERIEQLNTYLVEVKNQFTELYLELDRDADGKYDTEEDQAYEALLRAISDAIDNIDGSITMIEGAL
jgi:hypothetical protein